MGFTLFIDNLPKNFIGQELRKLFSNQGQVADAYIPQIQRRKVQGRFGFVEVQSRQQGETLIQETDGTILGHHVIQVQWAKYPKRSRRNMNSWQPSRRGQQIWNGKWDYNRSQLSKGGMWRSKSQTTEARLSGEFVQRNKKAKVIKVEKAQDNLEWLDRSLICVSDDPKDIEKLRTMICNTLPEVTLVRDLGKFKFLLTMDSKESEEKLKNEEIERLQQWFSFINDWAEEDVCQTRRLWLEIVGVPIQIWSEQNIRKIAENWGDVVFVDKGTASQESFASAKVVIDTLRVHPIEDEAIIHVEDKGFRVSVFEARTEFTIIHMGPMEEEISSPSRETN